MIITFDCGQTVLNDTGENMDKIICIGKNYLEHAKELGDAVPDQPTVFLKPPSVALHVKQMGDEIEVKLPKEKGIIHHECEIILKLDRQGQPESVSLGLDLTLRDLQSELKKKGLPWEISKVFLGSAILGPWQPLSKFSHYLQAEFAFLLDGKICQKGKGQGMRFKPEECLKFAGSYFPLCEGDILFTGTPAGVGPVRAGQRAEIQWEGKTLYSVVFN